MTMPPPWVPVLPRPSLRVEVRHKLELGMGERVAASQAMAGA